MANIKTVLTNIRKQLEENFIGDDIKVSHKNGNVRVYKGYFYTGGKDENDFAQRVERQCKEHGIPAIVWNCGNVWKPFKGGASVRAQSHFWVDLIPVNKDPIGDRD